MGDTETFWQKNKERLWAVGLLVFGAFGGNVDRLYSNLPDVYGVAQLKADVKALDVRVSTLEGNPDVKVTRPEK